MFLKYASEKNFLNEIGVLLRQNLFSFHLAEVNFSWTLQLLQSSFILGTGKGLKQFCHEKKSFT